MFISMCWLRVTVFWIRSVRSGLVAGDPDPIQIRARSGPDTMAIRRPAYGMIRKSVSVRAVKIRQRFGFETTSIQVSVLCLLI